MKVKKNDGTIAATRVVIVCDDNGRIHCLDADGLHEGTTFEYWSYPSTPNPDITNWTDPNQVDGLDGVYVG